MGAFLHNYHREVAQLGRALGLGPRGRRFESCKVHEKMYQLMEDYPSPAEGNGLENRQACKSAQGFESLILLWWTQAIVMALAASAVEQT